MECAQTVCAEVGVKLENGALCSEEWAHDG